MKNKIKDTLTLICIFITILLTSIIGSAIDRKISPCKHTTDTIYIEKLPDSLMIEINELKINTENTQKQINQLRKEMDLVNKDLMDFFD